MIEELSFEDIDALRLLCGDRDQNLRDIEAEYRITIHPRGNLIRLIGSRTSVRQAEKRLHELYARARHGEAVSVTAAPVSRAAISDDRDVVLVTYKNVRLGAKTAGQRRYLSALDTNDIVFAVGPAGTGKTYLAVLVAVRRLLAGEIQRIILARPAVEAGEKLGFLPGDLSEKVNPYLRPLYDALHDMLPFDRVQQMIHTGEIEVAPLAFMRGRTLNDAFIILDEAQNTTPEQMKMFLTRIGERSRVAVTGDITQTDLATHRRSGLAEALEVLANVEGIGFVHLTAADIVRHRIVQAIIDAYAQHDARQPALPLSEQEASS
ncbi:MAG: PhoH family protein [Candidatus Dadabacteria bacterium]|nr:MAG: PhoH family protein [Candidatus Dadabacteria bacterium]